jgi:hypothetical protein
MAMTIRVIMRPIFASEASPVTQCSLTVRLQPRRLMIPSARWPRVYSATEPEIDALLRVRFQCGGIHASVETSMIGDEGLRHRREVRQRFDERHRLGKRHVEGSPVRSAQPYLVNSSASARQAPVPEMTRRTGTETAMSAPPHR